MIGLFQHKDAKAPRRKGWPTLPSWSAGFSPLQRRTRSRPRLFETSFLEHSLKRTEVRAPVHGFPSAPTQPQNGSQRSKARRCAGFTFKELIVVLAVMGFLLLAGLVLQGLPAESKKARRIGCLMNLKQVGTSFRLWAGDNLTFPTQVSTNRGGALELADGGEVWAVFRVMSNELNTPKILYCPADTRQEATNFGLLQNTNVSYFVMLDAIPERPGSLLIGDRNLELAGKPVPAGRLELRAGERVRWTKAQHNLCGNIGLADGSAQQLSSAGLQEFLRQQQPLATNRIVIP
jgi:type II secretory pathway pseudopilin PulG